MVQGYIRPGCVHLTMDLLVSRKVHSDASSRGLKSLLEHLIVQGGDGLSGNSFWRTGVYTAQLFGQLAVVEAGQLVTFVDYGRDYSDFSGLNHPQRTPPGVHQVGGPGIQGFQRGAVGASFPFWSQKCESKGIRLTPTEHD